VLAEILLGLLRVPLELQLPPLILCTLYTRVSIQYKRGRGLRAQSGRHFHPYKTRR
jgi:hypothetical protein